MPGLVYGPNCVLHTLWHRLICRICDPDRSKQISSHGQFRIAPLTYALLQSIAYLGSCQYSFVLVRHGVEWDSIKLLCIIDCVLIAIRTCRETWSSSVRIASRSPNHSGRRFAELLQGDRRLYRRDSRVHISSRLHRSRRQDKHCRARQWNYIFLRLVESRDGISSQICKRRRLSSHFLAL